MYVCMNVCMYVMPLQRSVALSHPSRLSNTSTLVPLQRTAESTSPGRPYLSMYVCTVYIHVCMYICIT